MSSVAIDQARAVFYRLFATFFTYGVLQRSKEDLIQALTTIEQSDFDDEATKASGAIVDAVRQDIEAIEREYEDLFVLPFDSGVPITASYYHDEREAGAPLVKMRELLSLAKMIKNSEKFSDNEDHFGAVFGFAARLLADLSSINGNIYRSLYNDIISPYAPHFAHRILNHNRSNAYKDVALLLDRFLSFEKAYIEGA